MALTQAEIDSVIQAVIQSLNTNSKNIGDLTPVQILSPGDYFEIGGGKKVSYEILSTIISRICSGEIDKLGSAINLKADQSTVDAIGKTIDLLIKDSNKLNPLIVHNIPSRSETLDSILCDYDSGDFMMDEEWSERIGNIEFAVENYTFAVPFYRILNPFTNTKHIKVYADETDIPKEGNVWFDTETNAFYMVIITNKGVNQGLIYTLYPVWDGRHQFYKEGKLRTDCLFVADNGCLYVAGKDHTTINRVGITEEELDEIKHLQNSKQDALTVSSDLDLTDNRLAIKEAAKRAVFNDEWNALCGEDGKYDPDNAPDAEHQYLLNKIWLTYEEAITIRARHAYATDNNERYANSPVRTNIPNNTNWAGNYNRYAEFCSKMETAVIPVVMNGSLMYAFYGCTSLHTCKIKAITNCSSFDNIFGKCANLQNLELNGLSKNINLADSPLLSLASFQYLIANAANGTATITVTVHPDVYAKLTDTANTEWYKVLTDAANRYISLATV